MLFYVSSGVTDTPAGCPGRVFWPGQSGVCVAEPGFPTWCPARMPGPDARLVCRWLKHCCVGPILRRMANTLISRYESSSHREPRYHQSYACSYQRFFFTQPKQLCFIYSFCNASLILTKYLNSSCNIKPSLY